MAELMNARLGAKGDSVVILDQTALPGKLEYQELYTLDEMVEAIKLLRVRGAPAIGIFAGFALKALSAHMDRGPGFYEKFRQTADCLIASRPTAVNLSWAANRMCGVCKRAVGTGGDVDAALLKECTAIYEEDVRMCRRISEHGAALIRDGMGILTHCNAGPLATSRYGTALGPMILAAERGVKFKAYADETRPLLQGARLTAYELLNAGVDVTLLCDNMASYAMQQGLIQAVFVGCDRVAMNGDTANKIGTSGVAVLAKHYGIPFYVLGPTSTIDPNCPTGADIRIEMRQEDEIRTMFYKQPMAPEGVKCLNPAFDVTDASLITGIITQHGIARAPYEVSLSAMLDRP